MKIKEVQKTETVAMSKSIRMKVSFIILVAILIPIVVIMSVTMPTMRSSIKSVSESYMQDLCATKRDSIQLMVEEMGEKNITNALLKEQLEGVGMKGKTSSYMYLVSKDGTMLYHPTETKIGNPVENTVAKDLVAQIQKGNKPADGVIRYTYEGVDKYAAYCITDNDWIVLLNVNTSEVFASVTSSAILISIISLIIILILVPLGYWISVHVTNPIVKLSTILFHASKLDFTQDPSLDKICKRNDESGLIGRAVKELSDQLSAIITTIQKNGTDLASASERMYTAVERTQVSMNQVDHAVSEIAQGATQQAQDTTGASTDVGEMGELIEHVKKEVDEVTKTSGKMLQSSADAMTIIHELKNINETVTSQVELVSKQTTETNLSVQKIQTAANIITEIATQTNLLSLNASIEAARAGEAGKGFSVVADEIKQLSEQSRQSATEIHEIVNVLMNDSEQVVSTMVEVSQSMNEQSDKVLRTNSQFEDVKSGIDASEVSITDIDKRTAAIDNQRAKIINVISELSAIAEENAASSEETSAAITEVNNAVESITTEAMELEKLAEQMNEKLRLFKF